MFTKKDLIPTHVPFVDRLLGGGTKRVGVYGLLSPTGVGKSVLAANIAVGSATGGSVFDDSITRPDGRWVFVSLHNNFTERRVHVYSDAACISRDQVWKRNLKVETYEASRMDMLPKQGGIIIPPMERRLRAIDCLNHQLMILDETPDDPVEYRLGVPAELERRIRLLKRKGQTIEGIVIDGVPDIWEAIWRSTSLWERKFLEQFVSRDCRQLAERYQCPVWVTHQLSGAACALPPTAPLTHRNASDCKTIADSMDACFVMGTLSNPTGVFSMQCTKGDRNVVSSERILLKHDEHFSRIVEVKGYVEDRRHKTWKKAKQSRPLLDQSDQDHIKNLLKKKRKSE